MANPMWLKCKNPAEKKFLMMKQFAPCNRHGRMYQRSVAAHPLMAGPQRRLNFVLMVEQRAQLYELRRSDFIFTLGSHLMLNTNVVPAVAITLWALGAFSVATWALILIKAVQ